MLYEEKDIFSEYTDMKLILCPKCHGNGLVSKCMNAPYVMDETAHDSVLCDVCAGNCKVRIKLIPSS